MMETEFYISSEYVEGEFLERFNKVKGLIINEYKKVIDAIEETSMLPYIPTVYVIPFVIVKVRRGVDYTLQIYYYNLTYLDPKDFEKWALYSTLDFLEKASRYIAGGLGHEIAHIMRRIRELDITRNKLIEQLLYPDQAERRKEKEAEEMYQFFKEPIRKIIREWDALSTHREIKDIILKDASTASHEQFESLIFKDKKHELHAFIKKKAKNALSS